MKIAVFDCFAGASGNMILGSLVHAGLPVERLVQELRRLPVEGWDMHARPVTKRGLAAVYLDVRVPGEDLAAHQAHTHDEHTVDKHEPYEDAPSRDAGHGARQDGDAHDADAHDGNARDGNAHNGDAHDADAHDGNAQHGDTHHGDAYHGHTHQGDAHHGSVHDHAHADHRHEGLAHRRLADVLSIVHAAGFPADVERTAEAIFRRLAQAEAKVHGTSLEEVIFHEVGQIDAILDICGAALALHMLGIEAVYCSALPYGGGRIHSAHGEMPSPAPATVELLRDAPVVRLDTEGEFVTPTGAAILTTVASFATPPAMRLASSGYGAGRSDFPFPNVLRVLIGQTLSRTESGEARPAGERAVQLAANIDDMSPEVIAHATERLFAAGALDVWTEAAGMKKGRPGTVLCALCLPEGESAVSQVLLAETTTIGLRAWDVRRTVLERRVHTVATSFGPVRVKVVESPVGRRAKPEYEDCRVIAEREGLPLLEVMRRIEAEVGSGPASADASASTT